MFRKSRDEYERDVQQHDNVPSINTNKDFHEPRSRWWPDIYLCDDNLLWLELLNSWINAMNFRFCKNNSAKQGSLVWVCWFFCRALFSRVLPRTTEAKKPQLKTTMCSPQKTTLEVSFWRSSPGGGAWRLNRPRPFCIEFWGFRCWTVWKSVLFPKAIRLQTFAEFVGKFLNF